MNDRMIRRVMMGCVALAVSAAAVFAQDDAEPKSKRPAQAKKPLPDVAQPLEEGRTPAAATIDRIMETAVRNIAARYNLNDVQTQKTQELMKREVYRFLKEHESEVWPIIRDLLRHQLRAPDNPESLKRIGRTARPLTELAKKAIFDANEEWRLMLTPEQKRMHDFDLAEMEQTFEQIDQNFAEWSQGRANNANIFPEPRLVGQPPRPPQPPKGKLPDSGVREIWDPKHVLETLVENFIQEYELDESQITSARSILAEYKLKAEEFRQNHKEAFTAIVQAHEKAREDGDLDAMKRSYQSYKQEMLEPVSALCDNMNERLMALLTTAQVQKHAERQEAERTSRPVIRRTSSKEQADPSEEGGDRSDSGR